MRRSTFRTALLLGAALLWGTLSSGVLCAAATLSHLGVRFWDWLIAPTPDLPPRTWLLGRLLQSWPTERSVRPVHDQRPQIERFRLARNEFSF